MSMGSCTSGVARMAEETRVRGLGRGLMAIPDHSTSSRERGRHSTPTVLTPVGHELGQPARKRFARAGSNSSTFKAAPRSGCTRRAGRRSRPGSGSAAHVLGAGRAVGPITSPAQAQRGERGGDVGAEQHPPGHVQRDLRLTGAPARLLECFCIRRWRPSPRGCPARLDQQQIAPAR
jgi:hypothetical protein